MGGLDGQWVRTPAAYCALHKCVLSVKQIRMKECIPKKCWHMRRLEHPYWKTRQDRRRIRNERRERMKGR